MIGKEITDTLAGALETHHMGIEMDIYHYLERLGEVIDTFNSPDGEIPEARELLKNLRGDIRNWKEQLDNSW